MVKLKHVVVILSFVLCAASFTMAQSKLYVAGGLSNVFGKGVNLVSGADNYGGNFDYYVFDVEYQRRIIGSFNAVAGISVFTAGYNASDNSFSSKSKFDATYIAMPLMARWNVANLNYIYLDFGAMPYYMAKAQLKESVDRFNRTYTVEGDITQYSNRFYYAFKFQFLILFNRFYFGMYVISPPKGQSTLKDLEGHWGLNAQESTYLLSNGLSDYSILGLKLGIRIK